MTEKLPYRHQLEPALPSNDILNQLADEVPLEEIHLPEIQFVINEMLRIANGIQGDATRRTMVGLAAPQLEVSKRIILVDIATTGMAETPDLRVYINPRIIKYSAQTEPGREGCFSTGCICGNVERASEITIEAYDKDGNLVRETWVGFTARIFQHEIDHLDGIRFPDRITDDSKLHWVEPDDFGRYRTDWADWTELCTRDTWQSMKAGDLIG